MKIRILFSLVVGLVCAGSVPAQTGAPADTTQAFPARVKYRSTAETLVALPGDIVYLPIGAAGFVVRKTVALVYEERLIHRIRGYLTFMHGRAGIRLLSNTNLGSGGRVFFKDLLFGADADFTSTFGSSASQRRLHLFALQWPNRLQFAAQFRKEPKESFYGIGVDSQEDDKTSFLQEEIFAQLTYQTPLNESFNLSVDLNYHSTEIGDGESSSAPSLTATPFALGLHGLEDRAHLLQADLALRASFVDVPGSPTRGNRTLLQLGYNQSTDGDELSHLNLALVSEQFLELFYRRTVSLRVGTDWRYAPGDDEIPFYILAYLGGQEVLRGFQRGRFRDRGTVFSTTTYRFPIWKLVEGTVFYETGRTLHGPDDFAFSDWENSLGGSMRMWMPDALVGELILARSSEKLRLLFNFKTTF